ELENTIERAVILSDSDSKISMMALGLMPMAMNVGAPVATQSEVAAPEAAQPVYAGGRQSSFSSFSPPASFAPSNPETTVSKPAPSASLPVGSDGDLLPLEEIEKQHILATLESTGANRTQAAKHLGISIRTLRNKLAAYRKDGEYIPGED
ncbi:MAG: helix-turn-helix domain-containing protein, partial [Verrucomicrobiota bacterium]